MACGRTPCEDELGLPCGSASLEVCPFASTGGAPEAEPKSSPATDCESGLCRERVCFWGSGSPPAWRVLIALEEKGLEYRSERVSFESGILKTKSFLDLNPRGMVPIFVDGEVVMYESLAILQYIETFYPDPPLLPADRIARAQALVRMQEANNLSVAAGDVVYYLRRTAPEHLNAEYLEAKRAAMHTELLFWERHLETSHYLAGPGIGATMADFSFFPNLAYMVRLGLELVPRYPHLSCYFRRMCARPSVLKTWPPHWKETPGLPLLSERADPLTAVVAAAATKDRKPDCGCDSECRREGGHED